MSPRASADADFDALVDACLARLRAGESLDAEALARAHPAHAERLRAVVPVLVLVERVKAPAAAAPRPPPPSTGAPPDLPPRLGRWRLGRELGRGGMGRVLEAFDDDGRRAARKVIHAHLLEVPGSVERFLREAEAGRRLDHPRVVRTLEAGQAPIHGRDTPWIALEHVEGRDLRQVLDEAGHLSERLARAIGQGVAEGLAAIHAAGLVHRDVKPENVLLTPREEVRLTDLGLALVRDAALRVSGTGDFVGTLLYAAPEQLAGQAVGPAADLHALGLVLHELVTGRHPLAAREGAGPPGLAAVAPLERVADVSPWFAALVRELLEPDPARRPASAAHVAQVLREGEGSAWWRERAAGRGPRRRLQVERAAPLIGREDERARLDEAWAAARGGHGRVVLVLADAGLGKSRLVDDWLERVEREAPAGLRVAVAEHARGHAAGEVPHVAAALRELLGPGDLGARLAVLLDEGAALAPALAAHLEGRASPTTLPEPALAAARRLLLRGLAREGPVALVAEDLDAAPEPSREAFLALARGVEHERALLVATAAPALPASFHDSLRALPWTEVVRLDPLGRDASHDLFLAALGEAPSSAPWHEAVRGSGGNPLCLVEWARSARSAPEGLAAQPLPEVLRRLLERRLGALSPEQRHLLAVAASAGERFDPGVVAAAAGLGRLEGLRQLHALDREHGLLVADAAAYRFRHAAACAALADDLPPALRAEIHGALARAFEEAGPSPSAGAQAAAVVHHAVRGPRPNDALPRARQALEFLSAAQRPRSLAALCEALLALPGGLDPQLEALARLHLGQSQLRIAPPASAIPHLKRGLALAQAQRDDGLILLGALPLARALSDAGRVEEALAVQRVAQACAERRGAPADLAQAAILRYELLHQLGRLAEAGAAASEAAAQACAARDPWLEASAAYFVGTQRVETGDVAGARAPLEASVRGAQALGDRGLETSALTALSKADFVEGRLDAARDRCDRLIAIAREQGELRSELITRSNLASLEATLGRLREAHAHAGAALDASRRAGYASVAVHAGATRAFTGTLLGAWAEAARDVEEAAAGARASASPLLEAKVAAIALPLLAWSGRFDEAQALHAAHAAAVAPVGGVRERLALDAGLAEVHAARGDTAVAAALLRSLVAQARALHLAQEGARWALALGIAACDLGKVDEARAHLEAARDAADRMGARGLSALARVHVATLPGAERVLGRVALTEHADALGAHPRLRATAALARVSADPALWRSAAADLERLASQAPAAWRASLLDAVPLHRALRAAR